MGGYAANPFPIGPALLWLPGYLVGLALDSAAGAAGWDTGPTGYGLFAAWGAALAAALPEGSSRNARAGRADVRPGWPAS